FPKKMLLKSLHRGDSARKLKLDKLINKSFNILNELTNKEGGLVRTTNLSNGLLETLKIIENCTDCKNEIEKYYLNYFYKYRNEGFLYVTYVLNGEDYYGDIQWIPFNEFKNIKYLAKGGFGEVHKATWINYYHDYYEKKYKEYNVVLKRIYNSSDKIVD